jgi:hypothetical protein
MTSAWYFWRAMTRERDVLALDARHEEQFSEFVRAIAG